MVCIDMVIVWILWRGHLRPLLRCGGNARVVLERKSWCAIPVMTSFRPSLSIGTRHCELLKRSLIVFVALPTGILHLILFPKP